MVGWLVKSHHAWSWMLVGWLVGWLVEKLVCVATRVGTSEKMVHQPPIVDEENA